MSSRVSDILLSQSKFGWDVTENVITNGTCVKRHVKDLQSQSQANSSHQLELYSIKAMKTAQASTQRHRTSPDWTDQVVQDLSLTVSPQSYLWSSPISFICRWLLSLKLKHCPWFWSFSESTWLVLHYCKWNDNIDNLCKGEPKPSVPAANSNKNGRS